MFWCPTARWTPSVHHNFKTTRIVHVWANRVRVAQVVTLPFACGKFGLQHSPQRISKLRSGGHWNRMEGHTGSCARLERGRRRPKEKDTQQTRLQTGDPTQQAFGQCRSRSDTSLGTRQRFRCIIQPAEGVLQQSKHCGGQDFPWRAALRQFLACCLHQIHLESEWNTIVYTNLRRGQQQNQQWRQVVLNGAGSSPNPCALDVLDPGCVLQQDARPPLLPDVGPRAPMERPCVEVSGEGTEGSRVGVSGDSREGSRFGVGGDGTDGSRDGVCGSPWSSVGGVTSTTRVAAGAKSVERRSVEARKRCGVARSSVLYMRTKNQESSSYAPMKQKVETEWKSTRWITSGIREPLR